MLTRGVRTIPTDSFSKWQAQCMLQPCSDSEEGSLQETSQLLETSLHDTSQESLELEKESTEESATSAYLSATASDTEFETMSTTSGTRRNGLTENSNQSLSAWNACFCFKTKHLCMSASRGWLSVVHKQSVFLCSDSSFRFGWLNRRSIGPAPQQKKQRWEPFESVRLSVNSFLIGWYFASGIWLVFGIMI